MQTGDRLEQVIGPHGELGALVLDIAATCTDIAALLRSAALGGVLGSAGSENVQGETQKKLDIIANDLMLERLAASGRVAGMASEEIDHSHPVTGAEAAPFLAVFDPLDGSSNIDVNISVGSIFSVLPWDGGGAPTDADYLQPGRAQLASGFAIYGAATLLVLTFGEGVLGFTLDPASGHFVLTQPSMRIPQETGEFSINASNQRFWEAPVQAYIADCLAGKDGPRGKNFNMRWVGSMVADVYRTLYRGGLFMYPKDLKDPAKPGKLRLMYEANPIGWLVEQAGGGASTGRAQILDIAPETLHQRVPVIMGSLHEVKRLEQAHAGH